MKLGLNLCANDDFEKLEKEEETSLRNLHETYGDSGFMVWHKYITKRRLATKRKRTPSKGGASQGRKFPKKTKK